MQLLLMNLCLFLNFCKKNRKCKIKNVVRKCDSIIKDGKLSRSDRQVIKYPIKQFKMCSKRKIGTILRLNNESFEDEELSYELFLETT